MPVLAFFAVVGSVLVALLFLADGTLEQSGSPVIVTSQRIGLPAPRYDNAIKPLTTGSAPAPDMTSQAVVAAQPKSVSAPSVGGLFHPARLHFEASERYSSLDV